MSYNVHSPENVIAVTFQEDANAYEGLTRLKELDSQGQLNLRGGAVVTRDEKGQLVEKDRIGDANLEGTASGGIIGLLIGILGGPVGVLVGGATGVLIGSLFDLDDADETESVLGEISKSVRVGPASLLAHVVEQSSDVVDDAMGRLGGSVLRRSVDDVEAEIAATEKAQSEARKQARKALGEARHKKHKDEIDATIAKLKDKLHRNEHVAS